MHTHVRSTAVSRLNSVARFGVNCAEEVPRGVAIKLVKQHSLEGKRAFLTCVNYCGSCL
jgi:hypothetical protein